MMAAKEAAAKALDAAHFWNMALDLRNTDSADGLHRLGRLITGYADIPGTSRVMVAAERLNLAIGEWFKAADEIAEKATRDTST